MGNLRVLVIDDSLTIRGLMESLVGAAHGCEVVGFARDVEQARTLIEDCTPEVITLDLSLPGLDGMTYLDELGTSGYPPVIVISSSTEKGSALAVEAIRRGASEVFDKRRLIPDAPRLVKALRRLALGYRRRAARLRGPAAG